jgi:hypothetical protein
VPRAASSKSDDAGLLLKSAEGGKLNFPGTLQALQDLVLLTGVYGEWEQKPNGVWRYCSETGGGLNWSSTRGTLWFDGPSQPRARLQQTIEAGRSKSLAG